MRINFGGLALTFAACASIGFASPVLAPPAPPCSSFGTGPENNLTITNGLWTLPNFFCQQDDKIFSNFAITGGLPATTTLRLQEQTIGAVDFHILTFDGNFLAPFQVSYDIAVDLTMSPTNRIVRVSGDLSNPTRIGDPQALKAIYTSPGGVFLGSVSTFPFLPGVPLTVNETALHVVDSYFPNGGGVVSISNTFAQAEIPEPGVALLVGSGFVLLALKLKRKGDTRI